MHGKSRSAIFSPQVNPVIRGSMHKKCLKIIKKPAVTVFSRRWRKVRKTCLVKIYCLFSFLSTVVEIWQLESICALSFAFWCVSIANALLTAHTLVVLRNPYLDANIFKKCIKTINDRDRNLNVQPGFFAAKWLCFRISCPLSPNRPQICSKKEKLSSKKCDSSLPHGCVMD